MDIADRIADILVEDHVDLLSDNAALRRDAERFRWLAARFQDAYDNQPISLPHMFIDCTMLYGHRSFRRVEASLSWSDERDKPLALGEAIDVAMELHIAGEST
jgi:hypothetical protein